MEAFSNTPNAVLGWKLVDGIYFTTNNMRQRDIALIQKVAELAENPTFLSRIAPDVTTQNEQIEILQAVIENNKRAGCGACGNPSVPHLDRIDLYLARIDEFTAFHETENYLGLIKSLRNGHRGHIDAGAQTMRMAVTNPDNASGIIGQFEPPLGNPVYPNVPDDTPDIDLDLENLPLSSNHRGDYLRVDANNPSTVESLNELKSYRQSSIDLILHPSKVGKFTGQLKAYFRSSWVSDIANMNYYFDLNKLVPQDFVDETQALAYIKDTFRQLYTNPDNGIFEAIWENQNLRLNIFGDISESQARTDFSAFAQNNILAPENPLYKFIHVE